MSDEFQGIVSYLIKGEEGETQEERERDMDMRLLVLHRIVHNMCVPGSVCIIYPSSPQSVRILDTRVYIEFFLRKLREFNLREKESN